MASLVLRTLQPDQPPEIQESAVYIGAFATSDAQRQLLRLLDGGDEVGRPFMMSRRHGGPRRHHSQGVR